MITIPSIQSALKDRAQNAIFDVTDTGAPVNGTSGTGVGICGQGSKYTDYATGNTYLNSGTAASPIWNLVGGIYTPQIVSGTISAADITGTSAGQFGHASGYIMVAAPATGFNLILLHASIYYIRATATYGAGGNITVSWGAGGAALTGLVSAANSVGAASSKFVQFYPLSTAGVALVDNAALNLVSSVAFTNPGTAAGVIRYRVLYMLQPNT